MSWVKTGEFVVFFNSINSLYNLSGIGILLIPAVDLVVPIFDVPAFMDCSTFINLLSKSMGVTLLRILSSAAGNIKSYVGSYRIILDRRARLN